MASTGAETTSNHERRTDTSNAVLPTLQQRSREVKHSGSKPQRGGTVVLMEVGLARGYVNHARQPPAIHGRESLLIERGIVNHLDVERREQPAR